MVRRWSRMAKVVGLNPISLSNFACDIFSTNSGKYQVNIAYTQWCQGSYGLLRWVVRVAMWIQDKTLVLLLTSCIVNCQQRALYRCYGMESWPHNKLRKYVWRSLLYHAINICNRLFTLLALEFMQFKTHKHIIKTRSNVPSVNPVVFMDISFFMWKGSLPIIKTKWN